MTDLMNFSYVLGKVVWNARQAVQFLPLKDPVVQGLATLVKSQDSGSHLVLNFDSSEHLMVLGTLLDEELVDGWE